MIRKIRSYLSLKYVDTLFVDIVSDKNVMSYIDRYGDVFMKDSRWSFFSVLKNR